MNDNKNKRPCVCDHMYDDHVKQEFIERGNAILYCRECPRSGSVLWCYNYQPIGNLEYMEWLYDQLR